jgi:hypothetical protein
MAFAMKWRLALSDLEAAAAQSFSPTSMSRTQRHRPETIIDEVSWGSRAYVFDSTSMHCRLIAGGTFAEQIQDITPCDHARAVAEFGPDVEASSAVAERARISQRRSSSLVNLL